MALLKTFIAFFIFWGVIFVSALVDLQHLFARQVLRNKLKFMILSLVFGIIVIGLLAAFASAKASQQLPQQPVAFPHTIHAGKLGIACTFCHRTVQSEPVASIPSVEQCMFCHRVVGKEKPEIAKLVKAADAGTPLNWLRINRVPDTVHFNHASHIRVSISCSICHGPVEKMVKIKPVRSLKMGDCVKCHRSNSAPTGCSTCHY